MQLKEKQSFLFPDADKKKRKIANKKLHLTDFLYNHSFSLWCYFFLIQRNNFILCYLNVFMRDIF